MLKVSIVISILNSHEVVRRQIKYFKSLDLPDDAEIVFIDDGSDPPLKFDTPENLRIYPSGDFRPWTMACGRNLGAQIAQGEFLLMTDIDLIVPLPAIEAVRKFNGDKMTFANRTIAVLDENGQITQDLDILREHGLDDVRYKKRNLQWSRHTNSFAIRKAIFKEIGGYPIRYCHEDVVDRTSDRNFFNKYKNYSLAGKCKKQEPGPILYGYPPLSKDVPGLFHNLSREVSK